MYGFHQKTRLILNTALIVHILQRRISIYYIIFYIIVIVYDGKLLLLTCDDFMNNIFDKLKYNLAFLLTQQMKKKNRGCENIMHCDHTNCSLYHIFENTMT